MRGPARAGIDAVKGALEHMGVDTSQIHQLGPGDNEVDDSAR